jgi:hypothetical protein
MPLRKIALIGVAAVLALPSSLANADCVFLAQAKHDIVLLDRHTVLLTGGIGADVILKTFVGIDRRSEISVLRDSFCSFAPSVLLVDGELVSVGRVTAAR